MNQEIVLRFAPSPTGPLHIGGVRTALYNYLFAQKHQGRFILRIEDTDQTRYVPGAEEYIIEAFKWMGIAFTEGVGIGGEKGPYRQSERAKNGLYKEYAEKLLKNGHAYIAFDTPEELTAMRERLEKAGQKSIQYNYATRGMMKNSLSLSKAEVDAKIAAGKPYVIRMKMPRKEEIRFKDVVRNWVVIHSSQLDDKILLKSDGFPTYHLANVVDDRLMGITHVIRGEEWLPSTPLHVMLYRAFGWEDNIPTFVHLPLILNPDGKGKLSKRSGSTVFPLDWTNPQTGEVSHGFKEKGYLPEAMINFLALLGWNPGNDEEVMDKDRLIEAFTLERLGNSATNFDLQKLDWFNQTYLRAKTSADLLPAVKEELQKAGLSVPSDEYLAKVIDLLKERVSFAHEFVSQGQYFYKAPTEYNEKMRRKRWTNEGKGYLSELVGKFTALENWESEALHHEFKSLVEEKGIGNGKVLAPLRLALTGVSFGPGAFDIAALIGKEETINRIKNAIEHLPSDK